METGDVLGGVGRRHAGLFAVLSRKTYLLMFTHRCPELSRNKGIQASYAKN